MYPAHALDILLSRLVLKAALVGIIIQKETTKSFSSTLKLFQGNLGGKINNILCMAEQTQTSYMTVL